MHNERHIKRECGCEIEFVEMKGGPSKLYLNVCANHRLDTAFFDAVNALVKKFDGGLNPR